ncbi:zinc ribbon domain-containing protein [bacterium]|nr:zinc ribbon domain-containing protein [bacterium]
MRKDNKPVTMYKHDFLFGGLMTCKNCGSSIVGDIKKGKYIYYFCSDKTKGCNMKKVYVREQDIEKVVDEAIRRISLTEEQSDNILIALKDSYVDQDDYNKEMIAKLNKRAETLKQRLSNLYMDKLDKKITEEFWREKHNEWTYEVSECMEKIKQHTQASIDYMRLGGELLELLKNLYPRYIQQNQEEKKKLLKIIFSNFTLNGGNIDYTYKKPFDLIVEGASCSKWWTRWDSNPRPID